MLFIFQVVEVSCLELSVFFFLEYELSQKYYFLKSLKKNFFIVEIEAGLGWALMGMMYQEINCTVLFTSSPGPGLAVLPSP